MSQQDCYRKNDTSRIPGKGFSDAIPMSVGNDKFKTLTY
jgi:hypothetical protein